MKKLLIINLLIFTLLYLNVFSLSASSNPYLTLNEPTVNINNHTLRFEAYISSTTKIKEHGIIFVKGENSLLSLESSDIYKETLSEVKKDNTYAVNFIMPTYAMKDIITARAYAVTTYDEVIYSNVFTTSYEQCLNAPLISVPTTSLNENGICFETICYTNDAIEYGILVSLGEINNLDHTYIQNNPTTSDQFSVSNLDNSKSFRITLRNIPVRGYYQKLTIRSYVKYINKENNVKYYYSDHLITSYNEIINKPLLEDIKVIYNKEKIGLTFYTTTNAYLQNENDIVELGIIVVKGNVNEITIHSENAYIQPFSNINEQTIYLTIINFPENVYNDTFSSVGYIKYLDKEGNIHYYYTANITKTTYNQIYKTSVE